MIIKELLLNGLNENWNESLPGAKIKIYIQEVCTEIDADRRFPCVVVCPGGGYAYTSDREAEPIALSFAAQGYSVAVLRYSTETKHFPVQLCEASLVMAWLRRNADEFSLDKDKLTICGFSAGGHVAASLCNLWKLPLIQSKLRITDGENKPNSAILCYPVITSGQFAHRGSFENLLGETPEPSTLELLSLEKSANGDCPPTFLWHTADDSCVPCENSLLYAMALNSHNVPYELHIWPHGTHGASLCNYLTTNNKIYVLPEVSAWFNLAVQFLSRT